MASVIVVRSIAAALLLAGLLGDGLNRNARIGRVRDFITAIESAEVRLPARGAPLEVVSDMPIDTDDEQVEVRVAAGTELRFRNVRIEAHARLFCTVGASKLEPAGPVAPVACSIALVRDDGRRDELFAGEVEAKPERRRLSATLDLAALAGASGTLVVSTSQGGGDAARVAWSELRLESDGRAATEADRTMELDGVVCDLAARHRAGGEGGEEIALAVPGTAVERVVVPPRARLRFSTSVRPADASALFRVVAGDRQLFERVRSGGGDGPLVLDAVDLSPFAGREIELRFEASPAGDPARPASGANFCLPALLAPRAQPRAPRASGHPDLFLIVIDTLRRDALGCNGSARPASPELDAFARGARLFDRAYSQSSWTLPSTVTLLTGLHPDEHGARDLGSAFLLESHTTIAELLAAEGFTTGAFSGTLFVSRFTNLQRGFETFQSLTLPNARKLTRRVLDWVDDHEEDRLFAYVHYIDPHSPYGAPVRPVPEFAVAAGPYAHASFDELMGIAAGWVAKGQALTELPDLAAMVARGRALYDEEVHYCDRSIGELLAGLRARGRLPGAVVVVTADHGEEFLEHGFFAHGPHLYDESVRVPLIVAAPGLSPGRESRLIGGEQVRPLVLELVHGSAGRSADEVAQGHFAEFVHLVTEIGLDGDGGTRMRRDAIVRGNWKLIVTPGRSRSELYDLEHDPAERDDLAARAPALRAELEALLEASRRAHARAATTLHVATPKELADDLQRLGYGR